jgi:hypothetical protein
MERFEQHFRVATSREQNPMMLRQLRCELDVIVDLAVERDREPMLRQRLSTTFHINDAEPPMTQPVLSAARDTSNLTSAIRPAVREKSEAVLESRATLYIEIADDPAHLRQ